MLSYTRSPTTSPRDCKSACTWWPTVCGRHMCGGNSGATLLHCATLLHLLDTLQSELQDNLKCKPECLANNVQSVPSGPSPKNRSTCRRAAICYLCQADVCSKPQGMVPSEAVSWTTNTLLPHTAMRANGHTIASVAC